MGVPTASWKDQNDNVYIFSKSGNESARNNYYIWKYNNISDSWKLINWNIQLWSNTYQDDDEEYEYWKTGTAYSYGEKDTFKKGNIPPARSNSIAWVDNNGKYAYFFGGQVKSRGWKHGIFKIGHWQNKTKYGWALNDLWKFDLQADKYSWFWNKQKGAKDLKCSNFYYLENGDCLPVTKYCDRDKPNGICVENYLDKETTIICDPNYRLIGTTCDLYKRDCKEKIQNGVCDLVRQQTGWKREITCFDKFKLEGHQCVRK